MNFFIHCRYLAKFQVWPQAFSGRGQEWNHIYQSITKKKNLFYIYKLNYISLFNYNIFSTIFYLFIPSFVKKFFFLWAGGIIRRFFQNLKIFFKKETIRR